KNKIIKIYIKGKYIGKTKTNNKGIALFKYTKKHGKMPVKAIFTGDKLYKKTNKTTKIKL
ncbi:MAG: hypothetical protein ACRCVG_07605, partial [Methanobacteriaceae archaeon]